VALVWEVVWAEEASSQDSNRASEAASRADSEEDSEVEVALAHLVDSTKVVDTWLLDETLVTTCMPITTVLREALPVPEVLLLSHLDFEPSPPNPTSRSSFETYVSWVPLEVCS
jgi:hypothetical protein